MNDAIRPIAVVVEDDRGLGDIFSQALEASGFQVTLIVDGQQALEQLTHLKPVLIVLDLHLPHVSGENVLAYIRGEGHLRDTKVILATADAALANSIRAQADLVLLKPISFGQLKSLAQRLYPNNN